MEPTKDTRAIPENELEFTFSRSGGPGGQNVNKVATKVEVVWDFENSEALSYEEKDLVRRNLANRTRDGCLRVISQRYRSQLCNREDAVVKLHDLVAAALKVQRERKATKPTRASRERRLAAKRRRALLKELRSTSPPAST